MDVDGKLKTEHRERWNSKGLAKVGITPLGALSLVVLALLPFIPPFNKEYLIRWLISADSPGCAVLGLRLYFRIHQHREFWILRILWPGGLHLRRSRGEGRGFSLAWNVYRRLPCGSSGVPHGSFDASAQGNLCGGHGVVCRARAHGDRHQMGQGNGRSHGA